MTFLIHFSSKFIEHNNIENDDGQKGFGGSSVAILNMKKKNVLRMINFDAEVATVVRTTIARSDMNKYTFQNYSFVVVFEFLPRNKCL